MVEARVGIRVADDRQSVTVQIGPVDGPESPVGLSLDQLTKLIALLGQARTRMIEGTPKQSLEGRAVATVIEPTWYVKAAEPDGSLLAFDHPSYGPVAFVLPREDVARIARILGAHLTPPAGNPEMPN